MKFVSKIQNLQVVLRSGIPAEHLTGRPAVSGMYVRFKDGLASVESEEMVRLMMQHPSFNKEYVVVEENMADPYARMRQSSEPIHEMANIEYGHVGKVENVKVPKDQNKMIMDLAVEMAKKMAPEMAKEILKNMVSQSKNKTATEVVSEEPEAVENSVPAAVETPKKMGRPPRDK